MRLIPACVVVVGSAAATATTNDTDAADDNGGGVCKPRNVWRPKQLKKGEEAEINISENGSRTRNESESSKDETKTETEKEEDKDEEEKEEKQKVWQQTHYSKLSVSLEEHSVLPNEAPLKPKANHAKMKQVMFHSPNGLVASAAIWAVVPLVCLWS
ncbi:hypothetical protein TcWFU_003270 [Taenia crassiceps]|uniref:Uncharacterized protein n=1 Tax=Taenia crassiceps TaxID=6207 RepID=A0ABR4Q9T9_9CEST